ncbi:MAG: globin [Phototrophicaceae bacterium]|jgi:hemoglobin
MTDVEINVYEFVGGDEPFRQLVEAFYRRVEADPLLRPMFPEDLEAGKVWQFLFLTQYFGGGSRYIAQRGHPRLRMRHNPFVIDQTARDHWLAHMLAALDEVEIAEPARGIMQEYFERASAFLINTDPPMMPQSPERS